MKPFYFLFICCTFFMYDIHGQTHQDLPGIRSLEPQIELPKPLFKSIIIKDFTSIVDVKFIESQLKLNGYYAFYFNINEKGKIVPGKNVRSKTYRSLDDFIYTKFLNYTFLPARLKNNKKRDVASDAFFSVEFDKVKKKIIISISVENNSIFEIYNYKYNY